MTINDSIYRIISRSSVFHHFQSLWMWKFHSWFSNNQNFQLLKTPNSLIINQPVVTQHIDALCGAFCPGCNKMPFLDFAPVAMATGRGYYSSSQVFNNGNRAIDSPKRGLEDPAWNSSYYSPLPHSKRSWEMQVKGWLQAGLQEAVSMQSQSLEGWNSDITVWGSPCSCK